MGLVPDSRCRFDTLWGLGDNSTHGSLTGSLVLGIALTIVGIVKIVQAFQIKQGAGFVWQVLLGAIEVAGGILVYFNPMKRAIAITLLVALVLIAQGVARPQIAIATRLALASSIVIDRLHPPALLAPKPQGDTRCMKIVVGCIEINAAQLFRCRRADGEISIWKLSAGQPGGIRTAQFDLELELSWV